MTRAIPNLQPGLFDEIIVDNFAGGGGASLGMEIALGRAVDVAINHDREAVAMHMANHPNTTHYCEDVWSVDPAAVAKGRPVGLAWFSPDCKHFSKAKGGKPVSRNIRGLAWVVVRWAEKVRPRVIMLENVEEFQEWGPLVPVCDKQGKQKKDKDGKPILKPCGINKGATFYRWVGRLQQLGYRVEWKDLRACDYGAPTIRKRLFLVARCDGLPIVWPEPTHGENLEPYRTAAECIDWSIPAPSIFERKRPLAENTLKRIARGLRKFVFETADPFFVSYYGPKSESDFRGFGLGDQVPTQTTENRFGLVAPTLIQTGYGERKGQVPRVPGLGKPLGTVVAGGCKHALVMAHIQRQFGQGTGSGVLSPIGTITAGGLGKTALVSAFMAKHYGGNYDGPGADLRDPVPTVTTVDHNALVSSHIIKLRGTCKDGQPVMQPMPTVTAGGLHIGEVRSFLIKYYGCGGGQKCSDPMHTVTARDRLGLVTVAGQQYQLADIGMRMLVPRELYHAQGFPDEYVISPVVDGKQLTKTAQVRMCGNSVSPHPAAALVRANVKIGKTREMAV